MTNNRRVIFQYIQLGRGAPTAELNWAQLNSTQLKKRTKKTSRPERKEWKKRRMHFRSFQFLNLFRCVAYEAKIVFNASAGFYLAVPSPSSIRDTKPRLRLTINVTSLLPWKLFFPNENFSFQKVKFFLIPWWEGEIHFPVHTTDEQDKIKLKMCLFSSWIIQWNNCFSTKKHSKTFTLTNKIITIFIALSGDPIDPMNECELSQGKLNESMKRQPTQWLNESSYKRETIDRSIHNELKWVKLFF